MQVIAVKGWREKEPIRYVTEPLALPPGDDSEEYTVGLLADGFFTACDVPSSPNKFEGDSVAETASVMDRLQTIMQRLEVSWGDVIKEEGYYLGSSLDEWEPMARERFRRFHEGTTVATAVPWHSPWPSNVSTKVELLGYRSQLGSHSKPVPRADSWPNWIWDWSISAPWRQALRVDDCIWVGGQVPYGGRARHRQSPDDLIRQIDFVVGHIDDLLDGFNRRLDDVALLVCYFTSTGNDDASHRVLDRLTHIFPGQLPPVTLVPQPMMHHEDTKTEIWAIARA